jgi:hypothetical protein
LTREAGYVKGGVYELLNLLATSAMNDPRVPF